MKIGNRVRSCDKFGAPISLTIEGAERQGTLCGGLTSFLLTTIVFAYFCIRAVAMLNYDDPTISSFTINEDRSNMENPIRFGEFGQQLVFGFINIESGAVTDLDERIGSF